MRTTLTADGDGSDLALSSSAMQHALAPVFGPFSIRVPAPFSIRLYNSVKNT